MAISFPTPNILQSNRDFCLIHLYALYDVYCYKNYQSQEFLQAIQFHNFMFFSFFLVDSRL